MQHDLKAKPLTGLLVASVIVFFWSISLAFFLAIDITQLLPSWLLLAVLGRTFSHTGLFIVAHDAIHCLVFAVNRRLNQWIGQLTLTLYAILPYQKLSLNRWQHHRHPGQSGHPDFRKHHEYPLLPWYCLPAVRQTKQQSRWTETTISRFTEWTIQ